jgi:hypothetical protein
VDPEGCVPFAATAVSGVVSAGFRAVAGADFFRADALGFTAAAAGPGE